MQMTELVAGRELDALVAEKVMGWTVEPVIGLVGQFEVWRDPQGWRYGPDPKPYSTEIADAWQVVEHLLKPELLDTHAAHGFRVERITTRYGDALHWRAGYVVTGDQGQDELSYDAQDASTAPLAICRAALAAVSHG